MLLNDVAILVLSCVKILSVACCLPCLQFLFRIMPRTRPSTRIQRRAEPMATRPRSTRRLPPMAQDPGLEPPVSATPPEDVPPMAPTVPGTTPPDLPESTIARITSAVTQAVMESLQMPQHNPAPSPMESRTREVPLQGISVADAQGQGPVAAAMENLTGEVVELGVIRPHLMASSVGISNFNSVSIPIDAQVSPKIKAKEFIDFGLLINPQVGDTRYNLSLGTSEGSVPTLALEPTTKSKAIHNIEVWTTAFQVFVGVYTSKYPLEAPALMKYGEVVRDLAARGGNWQFYDTQFLLFLIFLLPPFLIFLLFLIFLKNLLFLIFEFPHWEWCQRKHLGNFV